jgi:hypothetical protein
MTYTYSWERTNTLSPDDFITWEIDEPDPMEKDEIDLLIIKTPEFDPDEIL